MAPDGVSPMRIKEILTTKIGLEQEILNAAGAASLSELGVDSIGVIEFQKVVSDEYGIDLPDEISAMNLTQIINYVTETMRSDC